MEYNIARYSFLELARKSVDPIYGVDNGTTMIPTGESDINIIWSAEGLNLQDEFQILYVVPKEGANFQPNCI